MTEVVYRGSISRNRQLVVVEESLPEAGRAALQKRDDPHARLWELHSPLLDQVVGCLDRGEGWEIRLEALQEWIRASPAEQPMVAGRILAAAGRLRRAALGDGCPAP